MLAGSMFPQAMKISVPNGVLTAVLTYAVYQLEALGSVDLDNILMKDNAIWGGFSFLLGFLVVFRTSQAYSRFWEGCTSTHNMGAEWFDACSSLIAFCKHAAPEKQQEVWRFQNLVVRLFSMLHSSALGDIEDCSHGLDVSAYQAFRMELIDASAIDEVSLKTIRDSDSKVELIFQWIQQIIVVNINTGVMTIPPPILTRSFQEMASGMVHFHNALKISTIPFPFPYAQTCELMLWMHWMMVPFIVCQWVDIWWLAGMFAFIQVFCFWIINMISIEIEHPFGSDPNDIDALQMQKMMNCHLRLLVKDSTKRTPTLIHDDVKTHFQRVVDDEGDDDDEGRITRIQSRRSFFNIWTTMCMDENTTEGGGHVTIAGRVSSVPMRNSTVSENSERAEGDGRVTIAGRVSSVPKRNSSVCQNSGASRSTIRGSMRRSEARGSLWSRASFSTSGAQAVPPLKLPLGTTSELEQSLAKPAVSTDAEANMGSRDSREARSDDGASDRPWTPSASSSSERPEPVLQPEVSHGARPPSSQERAGLGHGAPRRPGAGSWQAKGRWRCSGRGS
ncbi:unnamed protein product [Prorocentrum cordatum]|uniref:Bestrophin homolog n=1 Tax=Prorocentrum cordatum TaxID=2364126 RepID=A0ABN9SX58_9DINO|nr:unnamed protein product [Polarella glacialis]